MKSEPSLPEDAAPMAQPGPAETGWLSIDGESIPFTMQAEVGHMTIDEAIASGLFDLSDEPGMVRIPISMNVLIPNHLLFPPEPEPEPEPLADPNFPQYRNGVPPHLPGSPQGSRFGNYPRDIAAYNVLASFKSDMSPVAVAPVPGLPAAVLAAAGRVHGEPCRRRQFCPARCRHGGGTARPGACRSACRCRGRTDGSGRCGNNLAHPDREERRQATRSP